VDLLAIDSPVRCTANSAWPSLPGGGGGILRLRSSDDELNREDDDDDPLLALEHELTQSI